MTVENVTLDKLKSAIEEAAGATLSERRDIAVNAFRQAYEFNLVDEFVAYANKKNIAFLFNEVYYNEDGTGKLTLQNLKAYFKQNNITVRYNSLTRCIEWGGFGNATSSFLGETAPTMICDDLQKYLKKVDYNAVCRLCMVIATSNTYNPVLELIQGVKWDGRDRIEDLYDILKISSADRLSRTLIRKWLQQTYCLLHNSLENPFSADILLVFLGKQGTGKTRLFEKLALKNVFFAEGRSFNPNNKDSLIECTKSWICELGEIGQTTKHIEPLKAFITSSADEFRAPYGRASVKYPRHTSFCGSTNNKDFLKDQTGNRRFAVIQLADNLKIDYATQTAEFDALQLWAQIQTQTEYAINNNSNLTYANIFRLSPNEIQELEEHNQLFTEYLPGEQEILDLYYDNNTNETEYIIHTVRINATRLIDRFDVLKKYTATQILAVIRKHEELFDVKRSERIGNTVLSNTFSFPIKQLRASVVNY